MAVTVETLEKLERKITLTLPVGVIQLEVDARLKQLARTVKMDGFRPGKVPMNVVAQRYGSSVHYEVMNDKVGQAFSVAANEAKLRVAGQPRISENEGAAEGEMSFDVIFEVFPEVVFGDLTTAEVEKISADVSDAAIDKTLDILRKQRRTFTQRALDSAAQDGDRATIDFEGKVDGETFAGGKAEDFQFLIGDGQMLKEFEDAVRGMKTGESKTFPLNFPADYHGQVVAGKQADFLVTVKKLEAAHLPEVNEALAKSLGIADATVEGLRSDIKKNLEREVKSRVLARNKAAVIDALFSKAELDIPNAIVQQEIERMIDAARADLKRRGVKDPDKAPIPDDIFRPQRKADFDQSWSEAVSPQSSSVRRKVDISPVPKGIVAKLISGQGKESKVSNSVYSPRVQDELNKSIGKGLVAQRLSTAKAKEKLGNSIPSMFASFDI